jgi:hypothetical protein
MIDAQPTALPGVIPVGGRLLPSGALGEDGRDWQGTRDLPWAVPSGARRFRMPGPIHTFSAGRLAEPWCELPGEERASLADKVCSDAEKVSVGA